MSPPARENRCRLARERAGLSLAQAAAKLRLRLLEEGILLGTLELQAIEAAPSETIHADVLITKTLTKLYGVCVEWMLGEVALRDYAAIDKIQGATSLSFHDRDELAELLASRGRT